MRCCVALDHVGLNAAPGIHGDTVLGRPGADGLRIGVAGAGPPRKSGASCPLAGGGGVFVQCLTQFGGVGIIEINLIFSAIKGECDCLVRFGSVKIIFKRGDYSFSHAENIIIYCRSGIRYQYCLIRKNNID